MSQDSRVQVIVVAVRLCIFVEGMGASGLGLIGSVKCGASGY